MKTKKKKGMLFVFLISVLHAFSPFLCIGKVSRTKIQQFFYFLFQYFFLDISIFYPHIIFQMHFKPKTSFLLLHIFLLLKMVNKE